MDEDPDRPEPRIMAAHYGVAAARSVTPDDDDYKPAELLSSLTKLRLELEKVEPTDSVALCEERLEHVKQHVSNLIAAASNGTPPGAPEVWTLSVAVDYLCDHLTEYLRAELRRGSR